MTKKPSRVGRPRTPSPTAVISPLCAFIDAHWDDLGLTNEEAVSRLGLMAPNIISMWRTGRTPIPLSRLLQFAALLRVDPGELFVLWLKQEAARNADMPRSIVDMVERRLATENEARLLHAVRLGTRHGDPIFTEAQLAAFMAAI